MAATRAWLLTRMGTSKGTGDETLKMVATYESFKLGMVINGGHNPESFDYSCRRYLRSNTTTLL